MTVTLGKQVEEKNNKEKGFIVLPGCSCCTA